MKETKQFIGTLCDALFFLQEHFTMLDDEGKQVWKLCVDNNKFPTILFAGSLVEVNVEKCVYIAEQDVKKEIKPPTKSQLIEQELIANLGEEQIGAAKIVEPPKRGRKPTNK